MDKCFAEDKDGNCTALEEKICEYGKCAFYKTKEHADADRRKSEYICKKKGIPSGNMYIAWKRAKDLEEQNLKQEVIIIKLYTGGCGVIVYNKDHTKILLGKRTDGAGWCIAGGKREDNETPSETARRELKEEFGLDVSIENMKYLGKRSEERRVGKEC